MISRSLRSTMLYVVMPLGLAAAIAGAAIYVTHDRSLAKRAPVALMPASTASGSKFACPIALPPTDASEEAHALDRKAQALMGGHQFEKALTSYRELAKKDPAFPGINLDLSMAFSKMNQPQPAKQAIDAQLAISMCLAQLFPNELEPYCKAEGFASTAACVKEIGSVQQGAYIQAALVQMDVDHGGKPGSKPKPAAAVQVAQVKSPRPILVAEKAPVKAKVKAVKSPLTSLASGEGTDAALGAYSK